MAILILVGGIFAAGFIARGEAAGADARAYWAAVRIWLNGGDPYHPTGPFMPYVYAPWMLPIFMPWAVLPWNVAWFVWRGGTLLALVWTVHWAYRRRPLSTAVAVLLLSFPLAANIDTGNVNLVLALLLWATQTVRPRLAGLFWALSTATKWVPAAFFIVLAPRARAWGLAWLAIAAVLTLATLPATLVQLQTVLAFPRPARVDYLVLLWALVPWIWRHPDPLWWTHRAAWPAMRAAVDARLVTARDALRREPSAAVAAIRAWARSFLGFGA